MQTDTKELSKWKGRVEKRLAANTRLQDTRIPSEMEVPPHYKLFVHCLHFFLLSQLQTHHCKAQKSILFVFGGRLIKAQIWQKKMQKNMSILTFWSPQNFFGPLQWESWYWISRTWDEDVFYWYWRSVCSRAWIMLANKQIDIVLPNCKSDLNASAANGRTRLFQKSVIDNAIASLELVTQGTYPWFIFFPIFSRFSVTHWWWLGWIG